MIIQAGLAASEGRAPEALALYRDARRRLRDLKLVFDDALTCIDMATLLDPREPEVVEAAASARETLARLRARPLLDRLDAALDRAAPAPAREPARSKDPSTV